MGGWERALGATYLEQTADDREDYDCEDGDDDARLKCTVSQPHSLIHSFSEMIKSERREEGETGSEVRGDDSPAPGVEGGNDGFHGYGWDRSVVVG